MALRHGGNIAQACRQFGVSVTDCVDLSTGISPWSWPVPEVPLAVWQNLPQADGDLEAVAAHYFHCDITAVLAVPGSQYALQAMPHCVRRGLVAMPRRGYQEHCLAWKNAGHDIIEYTDVDMLQRLVDEQTVDHALLINPNNPTGETLSRDQVQALHRQLSARSGYLVIDEAFADARPEITMSGLCPRPGLIVYRSLGKFFGLAGVRLGFMLAPAVLCRELAERMPPWLLSHPARWIGAAALADSDWHAVQRERLTGAGDTWLRSLQDIMPGLVFVGTALFASATGDARVCQALFEALGRRGVLVRLFEETEGKNMLRFGLPHVDTQQRVLAVIRDAVDTVDAVGTVKEGACASG